MSAAEDADATDGSATIEHAVSGGGYGGVTVRFGYGDRVG